MNWSKLTYQQKNKVLTIGYVVFLFLVYQLAISKCWELYSQNATLEEKLVTAKDSYQNKEELEKRQEKLNHHISSFFVDSLKHQEYLLETISTYCHQHQLLIKDIPPVTEYREDDFEVGTHRMVIEGSFIPLLKLVYLLEQKNKSGRVSSVCFSSKYDTKRKKEVLSLILYIQNIQVYANEKES
ncbi:MAG: hypothetical protein JWO58_3106 [Chitinophagaceae bacterium]|nr:hypothetical protein [Chitinophagaceae bacterium]